jgi:hypothetical protein
MAGFVSSVEKWAEFSVAWKNELDTPPAIPFLHMTEVLREDSRIFSNVPMLDRVSKVQRLIQVINAHIGDSSDMDFNASMNLNDYNRILRPILKFHKRLKKHDYPYLWLFSVGVLEGMASLRVSTGLSEPVRFVFDVHGLFEKARTRFEQFRRLPAFEKAHAVVSGICEEDDKRFLPLQAADLFAWNLNRSALDELPFAVANIELLRSCQRNAWTLEVRDWHLADAARTITTTVILGPRQRR